MKHAHPLAVLWLAAWLAPTAIQAADPMLTLINPAQLAEMVRGHAGEPALVFTETREFPIRHVAGIPERWREQGRTAQPSFSGQAQPGEFFVFQAGVYALQDIGPLRLAFTDLAGDGKVIPATALRCLSLGGTNHFGEPFAKNITLKGNQLQALWIGVDVPPTAGGVYRGQARLEVLPGKVIPVNIQLTVAGEPLADHGDRVGKNLSRLRWLDSTVGGEPVLTQPFIPVQSQDRMVRVLGRELALGENGLPAQITSHFSASNTRIETTGREVLADPMAFEVENEAGRVDLESHFGSMQHNDLEARWTAQSAGGGWSAETSGRLDFTGSGEVRIRLTAGREMSLKTARLRVPWREDAARYFMGLDKPGGQRPGAVHWQWNVAKRQDCFWLGDVNAGLMLRLKDDEYRLPAVNIYYAFRPLRLPKSWGNEGRGGIDLEPAEKGCVNLSAGSGPRTWQKGESLDFTFEFYLTPFRTIDTAKQWGVRFIHLGGLNRTPIDQALEKADPRRGPNVMNIHHASFYCPYINYPYSDDSFSVFKGLVDRAHAREMRLRVYYTTREITHNMPELFPLHSFNGEILLPGPGKDARTLLHPKGPDAWLVENLRADFVPAWVAQIGPPYAGSDLSVITTPNSRWNNFYLAGLQWLVDKTDFDGIYVDDTALDATSLRRARRILDSRPGRIIDLHSWNHFNEWAGYANNLPIYMEILPYLDRLWLGEGFSALQAPWDFWLVEMSGLPFGLMSEMLDGVDVRRGMVFGETGRLGHAGNPPGMWRVWDDFGIRDSEMIGFYDPASPVKTDHPGLKATVYRKAGRALVALGSWAKQPVKARLQIDWPALGIDPAKAVLRAPAMDKVQPETRWRPDEAIPVEPGQGWLLLLSE